jgi:hypothetical protein
MPELVSEASSDYGEDVRGGVEGDSEMISGIYNCDETGILLGMCGDADQESSERHGQPIYGCGLALQLGSLTEENVACLKALYRGVLS